MRLLLSEELRSHSLGNISIGGSSNGQTSSNMEPSLISDAEDDDTEMVKLKPERPNLVWKDPAFENHTLLALNHLRRNKHFCDVTLQIGQHDILAHRVILAAASPYWMELFTSMGDQPTRKEIQLDGGMLYELNGGFQKDALERLVEYSYTSKLDIPGDQVKPVYMAAIRLKMNRVAAECARFMLSHLDLSSCLDLRSMPGIDPKKSGVEATNGGGLPSSFVGANEDVDIAATVDEFIESNFDRLSESRDLRALPRICIEILHLSKEEKHKTVAKPLCELALNWIRERWLEDESLTIKGLSNRRYLLFLDNHNTLQDCKIIERGSANDSDVIQDYQRENQHLFPNTIKKRRQVGPAVQPSQPRELLYSRHINQDDHAKQADVKDGWKVIACENLDDKSILAIVTIDRHLATFSMMQRINRPSSPPAVLTVTLSSNDLFEAGLRTARSPKLSRPPSIEKDLVYASVAPMPQAKSAVGAACLRGKLVVCGGYDRGECLYNFEEYDIDNNKWVKLPPMLNKRGRFDVTTLGDDILYAVAGSNGQSEEMSVEKFDFTTEKWQYVASLPVRVSNIGVCNLEGTVYCIGGTYGTTGTKYCFKLSQDEENWERIASMQTGRAQAAVTAYQGKIWVAGGCNAWNPLRSVEVYDPTTNTWNQGPSLSTPRRGCGLTVHKGRLIVVGGSDGTHSLCTTEIFDQHENVWKPGPTMTTCRTNVSVTVVGDRLWAVGGFSGKVFLNTVEYLDPETDEWTSFIALPEEMFEEGPTASNGNNKDSEDESSVITFSAPLEQEDEHLNLDEPLPSNSPTSKENKAVPSEEEDTTKESLQDGTEV